MAKKKRLPPITVGWREWVGLSELLDQPIRAKIDTGARTSAIHAWDIIVETDAGGNEIAHFSLHPTEGDDDNVIACSAPLVDRREIRSSNGEVEVRPVISTTMRLGDRSFPVELTLTDRDEMVFRMLVGRTALRRHALVDPGRSYLTGTVPESDEDDEA